MHKYMIEKFSSVRNDWEPADEPSICSFYSSKIAYETMSQIVNVQWKDEDAETVLYRVRRISSPALSQVSASAFPLAL